MKSHHRLSAVFAMSVIALEFSGCGPASKAPSEFRSRQTDASDSAHALKSTPELEEALTRAEAKATDEGRSVLKAARKMIVEKEIILGSCWDYIHAVYLRAGVTEDERRFAFRSKKPGPYAESSKIQPGDWLYFVNHSYGDVEHSAIFVSWIDREASEALMISYAGGNRKAPARYKSYDLTSVYSILRARDGSVNE